MLNVFWVRPTFWVVFALIGFAFLPTTALDYGIFGSTSAEIWAAMGWTSVNLSWAWFLPLLLFLLLSRLNIVQRSQIELIGVAGLGAFILISAKLCNVALGYAVFGLMIALLAIATNALANLKLMQGDRFMLAALLAIGVLIAVFMVYPIFAIFRSMFYTGNHFSPTFAPMQAVEILQQPYILKVIANSLSVAVTVGLLSTLLGFAFALYTTRIAKRTALIGRIFSILPIVTPPFVVGLGVTLMLGRSGYVTAFLVEYLGLPSNWLYGFTGIVLAHTLALTPIAFLILEGALKAINPTLEEAAYSLRANGYQTFFHLLFPLLKPALANAFLVVAIQSLADFSTPLVLGGSFDVIATQIYFYIAGSQLDYASASTLGSVLLFFSLAIFVIQYLWIGKRSYVTVSGKAQHSEMQGLPPTLKAVIIAILTLWGIFNFVLYSSIFYGSFTVNWGVDHRLTLDNYFQLFGRGLNDGAFPSLFQTILFAGISAPLTAFLGLLIAYLTVRREFKGRKTLEFLALLCFAVPGTVAGLAYLISFNHAPIYLTGTGIIIVLSMVMRNMPVGMRAAVAGLGQLDKALDEASLSLKANSFNTLIFIVFPLLKPALLSALVTSFVRAMTTVSAIVFLVTADTRVATSYILNRVEDGEYGIAVAYGSMLIVVMMTMILLFDRLVGDTYISRSKATYGK